MTEIQVQPSTIKANVAVAERIKEDLNQKFREIVEEKKALDHSDLIDILVDTIKGAVEEATRSIVHRKEIKYELKTEKLEEFINEKYYEYQKIRKGQHFWGKRRERLTVVVIFGTAFLKVNITYDLIVAHFDPHYYVIPTELIDLMISICERLFP